MSPLFEVPEAAGVYAIGHCEAVRGFEVQRTCVYVGESKNLRRRLGEHMPESEQNPRLREYLQANADELVVWFKLVDPSKTRVVQDELVARLLPRFNTVGIPGERPLYSA